MTKYRNGKRMKNTSDKQIFMGSGTTIECEIGGDGKFLSTIITTATLFTLTDGVQPSDIKCGSPKLDCKELYSLDVGYKGDSGGLAINCHGEVIGIMVCDNYFLPSNIVSRWWKHYKQHRNFCRPWLRVKLANLHSASLYFLEPFVQKFPNISTGVIVMKVAEDSLAYSSGLCSQDVIVQCHGESVRSILEFVENIWDKVGGTAEFSILRLSCGERLKLTTTIDETTPDKFYRWPIPVWSPRPEKRPRTVSDSESSDAE